MKKSTGTGINVGGASILVIFVLLCLTTFATLSLVSANADYRLSKRTSEAVGGYYAAEQEAMLRLSQFAQLAQTEIDATDADGYLRQTETLLQSLDAEIGFEREGETALLRFSQPIDDEHTLEAAVRLHPLEKRLFSTERWQVVYTGQWEANDSLMLWDGGETLNLMG